MALPSPTDLVEETIVVADEPISLLRPRDSDELLEEEAFDHEEFLPYWAELWPSSVALAKAVGARALRGAPTLELGCGLGLASIAAARAGGRVLATDWSAEAIRFTTGNAARNSLEMPGLNNWDLGLMKRTSITERVNTEFRAEFYNVWNHTQFGPPNNGLTAGSFGVIGGVLEGPRAIQLAFKLIW